MTCSQCDFAAHWLGDGAWDVQTKHQQECPGPPYRMTRARREAKRRQDRIERKLSG